MLYGDGSNDSGLIDIIEDWQTHYGEADIINPIFGLSASYGGGVGEMGPGMMPSMLIFMMNPGGGAGIGKHLRAGHINSSIHDWTYNWGSDHFMPILLRLVCGILIRKTIITTSPHYAEIDICRWCKEHI